MNRANYTIYQSVIKSAGILSFLFVYLFLQTSITYGELVAGWLLDETNGVIAVDSSANHADGIFQGGYTLGVPSAEPGIYNTAVDFNAASSGEVFKASWSVLNQLTNNFTVMAWINPDTTGSVRRIFSSSSKAWGFGLNSSNGLRLTTFGITDYDISVNIPTGTWTHIAATFSTSNNVEFYVNGIAVGVVEGTYSADAGDGNWFVAGNGTGEYFDGTIDEVRVFDEQLPPAIISTYSARLNAYWALNETTGTVAVDSGPYAIHGAYQGGYTLGKPSADKYRYGTSVRFDGQTGEVFKSDTPVLYNLTNNFTVTAWINPEKVTGVQRIFSSAGGQWGAGLNTSNLLFTSYGIDDFTSTATVQVAKWTHVAVSFSLENYISYYINGHWVQSIDAGTATAQDKNVNWFIASSGTGERFDGYIDEVRIYNRELPEDAIRRLALKDPPRGWMCVVR